MRMTKEQLIDASRTAAKYLPAASADIMNELANRLDTTSVALSESLEQRGNLATENTALLHFIKTDCYVAHFEPETFSQEEVTRYVSADGYEPELPDTAAAIAALRVEVWLQAKDLIRSAIATDSIDHIEFLFDGKVAQLSEVKEETTSNGR